MCRKVFIKELPPQPDVNVEHYIESQRIVYQTIFTDLYNGYIQTPVTTPTNHLHMNPP